MISTPRSVRSRPKAVRTLVYLWVLSLSTAACGEPECTVSPMHEDTNAPRLVAFRLNNQLRGDPWTLVFAATFSDADGDLAGGQAAFYLNSSREATRVDLQDVFVQSDLISSAPHGTLAIPLRFGDKLSNGARVRLSLQLEDEASLRSNCYSLDLRFAVDTVAAALEHWWTGSLAARLVNRFGASG